MRNGCVINYIFTIYVAFTMGCYGTTKDLQWIYYEFHMDLQHNSYWFHMDLLNMYKGFTTDILWVYYYIIIDLLWTYYGFALCWCGFTMDLQRLQMIYYGLTKYILKHY